MNLFRVLRRAEPDLRAVIEVDSHALRGVIFEFHGTTVLPKVLKKIVHQTSYLLETEKGVKKLHEFVFSIVKILGRVPVKITIGLGSRFGEYSFPVWKLEDSRGISISSQKDLRLNFQKLFEQHREAARGSIAYPIEIFADGYEVGSLLHESQKKHKTGFVKNSTAGIKELGFKTLMLYLPDTLGNGLMHTKQSLGGMPIEFVPQIAVYNEAVAGALGADNAFIIVMGGEETILCLIRQKKLVQFNIFPYGFRHFLRSIAKRFSLSFEEARELEIQYAKNLLSGSRRVQLQEHSIKELENWKNHFLEGLQDFYTSGPLPNNVLLLGSGAGIPEILSLLQKPDWIRDFSDVNVPNIRIVTAESIFGGSTLGGLVSGHEEVALASLIFYSLHHNPLFLD